MENNVELDVFDRGCDKMSNEAAFRGIDFSSMPCEKFKYLFSLKSDNNPDISNDDNFYNYINFWLNYYIREKNSNYTISVKEFYHTLQNHDSTFDNEKKLECKIYNINKDDFENMCILYNLYNNYNKIFKNKQVVCVERGTCIKYSKECCNEYKKGLIKCFNKQDKWGEKLFDFNNMYISENTNASLSGEFSYNDLIELPRKEDVEYELCGGLNNWKNLTMLIFSILGSTIGLFFYIYKVEKK
ncbi:VIR protein [Plasmodium vivax]|uniref:VIR protein n=1 Tax=Plasmodium vivax TaxID=5855 RepID=A0A1G4EA94_PLAVI|nr:VIR protein [Plasmodium vivax]